MRYLVIGLGIYGANLARDLVAQGHEVIGADSSRTTVDAIKDYITTAYVIDTTEEAALGVLPLRNVDLVVVAIGENFGASVKTVALLKKAGVQRIYARAIDPLHESILESFKVDRILRPEQRAALDLTHEMALGTDVEALRLTDDTFILKFKAPQFFIGLSYSDLNLENQYG
ncbi:MAG: TrkA family potassium uptake protein, partial [Muribaculaceae bacterium]|nr:TrkA family potassium uptake protein [Muribaculaceae bacterium]